MPEGKGWGNVVEGWVPLPYLFASTNTYWIEKYKTLGKTQDLTPSRVTPSRGTCGRSYMHPCPRRASTKPSRSDIFSIVGATSAKETYYQR